MKTEPLPYQDEAIGKVLALLGEHRFAMLEAGMGTGKTLMSMAIYEKLGIPKLVIVAPKTLLSSWEDQMAVHTDFTVSMKWDSIKASSDRYKKDLAALATSPSGIFLVNTEAFQRDNPQLLSFLEKFTAKDCFVILDESSKVKDQGAHRTKAIAKAFQKCQANLAMTGTMNANTPLDVYGQFYFLTPNFWKSQGYRNWHLFKSQFAVLQDCYGPNGVTFKKIVGYRRLEELRSIINPFIVTVDKEKVLDLPPKVWETVKVRLSREEKKAYDDMKRDMMTMLSGGQIIAADQALSLYNKFRMIAGGWIETTTPIVADPAKLATLVDLLEDSGEQVLIFANFTHEISQIQLACSKVGRRSAVYDGSVPTSQRSEIVRAFNAGEIDTIVAQPLAGAYGLNLQSRCNTIIYYSLPNSPEVFLQSQDRIHRMGQAKTCYYTVLEAEGTIDKAIFEALEKKQDLSKIFRSASGQYV